MKLLNIAMFFKLNNLLIKTIVNKFKQIRIESIVRQERPKHSRTRRAYSVFKEVAEEMKLPNYFRKQFCFFRRVWRKGTRRFTGNTAGTFTRFSANAGFVISGVIKIVIFFSVLKFFEIHLPKFSRLELP